jgi:phage/plasmid-associated DNA primase
MVRQFGTQSWIGKKVVLFPDVRTDGITMNQLSMVAEIFLSVTGEDAFDIDRKYKEGWNGKLSTRVILFSNDPIEFQDESGALPGRFITWEMKQSFKGREDFNLTTKLLAERPGILNLALDALDRLRKRGRSIQPESGRQMSEDLEGAATDIGSFIEDCCVIGPQHEILVSDAYLRWREWSAERGVRRGWKQQHFSGRLRAKVPTVTESRFRKSGPGRPVTLIGIGLRNAVGRMG